MSNPEIKRNEPDQNIPEGAPGPTMQEQIDQEMARRQSLKAAAPVESKPETTPSPADNPALKEAIARQREKLKTRLAGKAAAVPPPAESPAVAEDLPILEEVDLRPGSKDSLELAQLAEGNPVAGPKTELPKPEAGNEQPQDSRTEEITKSLEEMSSGKTAQEKVKENVAALEEMGGARNAENAKPPQEIKPPKEEKTGTDDIEEQAFNWVSGSAEPTAKVEEKPKTPREVVLELRTQISGLDQQIEVAQGRYRDVLKGGIETRAAAGPGAQAEVARLEAEKQTKIIELEKAKGKSKDRALEVLSAPDVMRMNPREVAESFGDFTENEKGERRHLEKESSEMAYKNERERGMTVLVGPEAIEAYRQRATKKEEEKIHTEDRSQAIITCWERLSEKDQKKFRSADSPEFKNYLDQKRQKLGVSENAFAGLVKMGFKPEAAKVKGWLGRLFGPAVEIPSLDAKTFLSSDGSKNDINAWVEANDTAKKEAEKRVDMRIIEGRQRLLKEKTFCTKQIIVQTIKPSIEPYDLKKPEVETVLEPAAQGKGVEGENQEERLKIVPKTERGKIKNKKRKKTPPRRQLKGTIAA